nr:MAG TPA: hypothetical protein [Caudoviricetes sp.]DAY86575.1 MAG TPA: hypothetical protein [Caudoviricetes sp.]
MATTRPRAVSGDNPAISALNSSQETVSKSFVLILNPYCDRKLETIRSQSSKRS